MIWGLVAAKAKQGLSAAASSDSEKVGASLRKAGTLCLLIIVASACNMYQQANVKQLSGSYKTSHVKL